MCPDRKRGAQAGEQRRVTEGLAFSQEVQDPALVEQLDPAGADDVEEPSRFPRLP